MDQTQLKKQQKCALHNNKSAKFIQVNEINSSNNENIFYCTDCVNEDLTFKGVNYLLISQIIHKGEKSILQKWPPVQDHDILEQLIHQTSSQNKSTSVVDQISNFFTCLKNEILQKIDFCQKKMINCALELLDNEQIIASYQQISKITEFRKLLMDEQKGSNEQTKLICKQFIAQVESQKDTNTKLLQNLLDKSKQKQNLVDFESPKQLKESIFSIIEDINFFPDNNHLNLKNKEKSNADNNSEKIMKLISNKSNFCSHKFLEEIRDKLKLLNKIFVSVSFDNMHLKNKTPINFSQLNDENLENIDSYVKHQINMNNNREYQKEIQSSSFIQQLEQVFQGKTNFIQNETRKQIINCFINVFPLLKGVITQNIITDHSKFNTLNKIDEDTLITLMNLLQKKEELSNNMNLSQTFQFINSQQINLNKNFDLSEIKSIFRKFPIFDICEHIKMVDILNSIEFLQSPLSNGKFSIIMNRNNLNQIEASRNYISDNTLPTYCFNCISNIILEKNKKYVFRIQIESQNQGTPTIGLMSKNQFSNQFGYEENLCCKLININDELLICRANGISKHVRGEKLKLSKENIIEMRVWLQGKQLVVLDYPNYEYKVELQDENKQKLIDIDDLTLYFFFGFSKIKYTIISAQIVNEFAD